VTTRVREGLERPVGRPVANPERPFEPPPGSLQRIGRELAGVVLGYQLATSLGIERGDVITIMTGSPDPQSPGELVQANRDFVVCGTFSSRENETDLNLILMDRRELHDFIGGRDFNEIPLRLHDYERDGAAVALSLRRSLKERGLANGSISEVRTWEQHRGSLLGAIENERVLMGIMLSLVLLVAGFTVFAILSMMVTEKRRDVGILTAMGATPRGVLGLFLLIAFWDALLGVSLGTIFGTWAAIEIDSIERWLSRTFGVEIFDRTVYYFDHIPSVVQPWAVVAIVCGAFLSTLLFAALPAWRASRLDPVRALRYE
jgi:lipoprotein-releasing system permease protein